MWDPTIIRGALREREKMPYWAKPETVREATMVTETTEKQLEDLLRHIKKTIRSNQEFIEGFKEEKKKAAEEYHRIVWEMNGAITSREAAISDLWEDFSAICKALGISYRKERVAFERPPIKEE